ncbi:MAG: hypothetical protein HQ528_00595 [Candidatus Marinimicrobia bacterium]|nr:hypothetical protein [Candidatus Neomarinimicrobiota bacterium]
MNLYFLIAALLLLLAFAHTRWGEQKVFPLIKEKFTGKTFLSVYVPWQQLTWILALRGLFMFLASIWKQGLASVAVFVLLLTMGNLVIFTILCWKQGEIKLITKSVPQYLLFGAVIILIMIGQFQA